RRPFHGEGAFQFGGRWSSAGTRLGYTAEHVSLAMIEYFVHIHSEDPPDDLVLVNADVPDDASRISISSERLPPGWRRTPPPPELAAIGDSFVAEGKALVLIVPSALAPEESNCLINPQHPDFPAIRIHA